MHLCHFVYFLVYILAPHITRQEKCRWLLSCVP